MTKSHLEIMTEAFDQCGIYYKKMFEDGCVFISPTSKKNHLMANINTCCDVYYEFDEDGMIASY